jgi:hypothetical protein
MECIEEAGLFLIPVINSITAAAVDKKTLCLQAAAEGDRCIISEMRAELKEANEQVNLTNKIARHVSAFSFASAVAITASEAGWTDVAFVATVVALFEGIAPFRMPRVYL